MAKFFGLLYLFVAINNLLLRPGSCGNCANRCAMVAVGKRYVLFDNLIYVLAAIRAPLRVRAGQWAALSLKLTGNFAELHRV